MFESVKNLSVSLRQANEKKAHWQTSKYCYGKIVSCQCFVMFPSAGKLGDIFVRNILARIDFNILPALVRISKH